MKLAELSTQAQGSNYRESLGRGSLSVEKRNTDIKAQRAGELEGQSDFPLPKGHQVIY